MHWSQRRNGELVELTVDDTGRSRMLATRNFEDWYTVVGERCRRPSWRLWAYHSAVTCIMYKKMHCNISF